MRQKFILWTLAAICLTVPSLAFSQEPPKSGSEAPKAVPIQVRGDTVEYFHQENKAVGTGHVSIDYQDVKLTADKMTVYMATKTAVAEGNVRLTQRGSVFTGDRAEFDFGKKLGKVSNMNASIEPSYFGKAAEIQRVSEDHYRAVDSYVTTCCGDTPFYKVGSSEINIYPDEKIEARNAILYIRNIPVIFIPYFVVYNVDFNRFPVQIIPGKNSEWGAFVLSKWRYHLAQSPTFESKGNVLVDWREKRGVGVGVENFYKGDKVGRGSIKAYYIDDDGAPTQIDSERYRGQWRHQSNLTADTTFTAEINKLSDDTVIKDFFFREEYEKDAFPDNYLSIITAKPEYTFSVLQRSRLDDFFTVVERSPELKFDTHTKQFADTPFYMRQELQFTNLKKEFANTSRDYDATRFDTNHTLLYAGKVGPVSVTPRIGTRQTYYSRDNAGEREIVRGTFDAGIDLSTKFYKTYDVYIEKFGLDYNQLRHIFTPTVSYNYRPNPTIARTTLQQFDEIDAIDKQHLIRFGFENKLQTKHKNKKGGDLSVREIARIIPFFDYDVKTGRIENLGLDAEVRPYTWLGIESDVL
ncbi:MAG TPA: putative LPS assembly protein LptD, partial [Candidatus Omnitrophota bacterium]|nr:putative LPS assembly protein LptD [Candidatus Omnitrophota bacterium]